MKPILMLIFQNLVKRIEPYTYLIVIERYKSTIMEIFFSKFMSAISFRNDVLLNRIEYEYLFCCSSIVNGYSFPSFTVVRAYCLFNMNQ